MITREQALNLLNKHIKTQNIIKHSLATEVLMKRLAKELEQEKNQEKWALAGLLHDLDWDYTKNTPNQHGLKSMELLENIDLEDDIKNAIKTHNYVLGIEPETLMGKVLYSTEMMTGFIVAVTLVRPSKKIADVRINNIMKKYNEKSFGAGAKREIMDLAPKYINLSVEKVAKITLEEMQKISNELGL